jgi:hypothetical protein
MTRDGSLGSERSSIDLSLAVARRAGLAEPRHKCSILTTRSYRPLTSSQEPISAAVGVLTRDLIATHRGTYAPKAS